MSSTCCTTPATIRRRFATPSLRLGTREVLDLRLAPVPNGPGALYFVLAAVGMFTLLVGGAVRLRRPRDPATLHFFWLAVAFFGVFTFSFSGRLDRLDWVFYWADVDLDAGAAAAVPALHAGVPRAARSVGGADLSLAPRSFSSMSPHWRSASRESTRSSRARLIHWHSSDSTHCSIASDSSISRCA